MPTTIHPLTGVQYSDNGFSLEPAVPDDLGKALYDLRRLLRGEHRFESEISEEIRKTVPELRARGQFVPWQVFTGGEGSLSQRDMVAGSPGAGGSFIQTERLPDIADALRPVSQVIASGATAYVFGAGRPSPNVNHEAGADVSPAVRDYLGLGSLGLVDWRFVEQAEVPAGPWSVPGENTQFRK